MSRPLHTNLASVQRTKGQSVAAKLAYDLGTKLRDEYRGKVHDYRRRSGVLATAVIGYPHELQQLATSVEKKEQRCDANLGRTLLFEIPHELSWAGKLKAFHSVISYVQKATKAAAVGGLHEPPSLARRKRAEWQRRQETTFGDDRNFHGHIYFPGREIDPKTGALSDKKIASLQTKAGSSKFMRDFRVHCAAVFNALLREEGHFATANYDPRKFAEQGITRPSTFHEGPAVSAMRRRNKLTPKSRANDTITATNNRIAALAAQITALKNEKELNERSVDNVSPNTRDVFAQRAGVREREVACREQEALRRARTIASAAGELNRSVEDLSTTDDRLERSRAVAARTADDNQRIEQEAMRAARRLSALLQHAKAAMNNVRTLTSFAFASLMFERLKNTAWGFPLERASDPAMWEVVRVNRELRAFRLWRREGNPVMRILRWPDPSGTTDPEEVKMRAVESPQMVEEIDQDESLDRMLHEQRLLQKRTKSPVHEQLIALKDIPRGRDR